MRNSFRTTLPLALLVLAACSKPAPDAAVAPPGPAASPVRAELARLQQDGPLPAARRASVLEFWLHYKLMQATGMAQTLGGEDRAIAALKAFGLATERSATAAQADVPRMLPANFDGNGMDAGVMGAGYGLIGSAITGGMLNGLAPDQVAQAMQHGPIKFDDKDSSAQIDIAQDGMDTELEQTIDESGVTGKVKTKVHLDACPDASGKLVVTIETESQMSAGGKSGSVKAKFRVERQLDDDARLLDGGDATLDITMDGTGAASALHAGANVSTSGGFQPFEESGYSVFRPEEAQHTADLMTGLFTTLQAMAEAMLTGALSGGEPPWESGRCVDLQVRSDPTKRKGVKPNTAYTLFAEPRAKSDGRPTGGTVKATLDGANRLNPTGKIKADAKFDYANPEKKDQSASIDFEARSRRGVGKATLDFDTKKGGYRIAAVSSDACAEPITVCDITKPFTNKICGGTVTWTHTPTGDRGGDFTFRFANGKGVANATGTYRLNGPDEQMTAIYQMDKICGHAAGMTVCAPPRTFGATTWTRIDDCEAGQ
jgi:hypothetical protein